MAIQLFSTGFLHSPFILSTERYPVVLTRGCSSGLFALLIRAWRIFNSSH